MIMWEDAATPEMSEQPAARPPATRSPDSMTHSERMRLRGAAFRASKMFPGAVGELLYRELMTWDEFGYRLGSHRLMQRVVAQIEALQAPVLVEPE